MNFPTGKTYCNNYVLSINCIGRVDYSCCKHNNITIFPSGSIMTTWNLGIEKISRSDVVKLVNEIRSRIQE